MKSLPIGSKRITKCGYVQIKTCFGQRRWSWEHRVVWEQYNKPLKQGEILHHINKDTTDNRIENLYICPSNSFHHKKFHNKRPPSHGMAVSNGNKGKPKTREHAQKISIALKGKHKSKTHRKHISTAIKNWYFNKYLS